MKNGYRVPFTGIPNFGNRAAKDNFGETFGLTGWTFDTITAQGNLYSSTGYICQSEPVHNNGLPHAYLEPRTKFFPITPR